MSMVKLTVPLLVGDQMRNPGEEVDMTDEGRVAFVMGMNYAEDAVPPTRGAKEAADAKDKKDDKDKPMGIFGKPQPEHHDDKKGK